LVSVSKAEMPTAWRLASKSASCSSPVKSARLASNEMPTTSWFLRPANDVRRVYCNAPPMRCSSIVVASLNAVNAHGPETHPSFTFELRL
jgi:hypothetical protein